jgi:hypothetical protein
MDNADSHSPRLLYHSGFGTAPLCPDLCSSSASPTPSYAIACCPITSRSFFPCLTHLIIPPLVYNTLSWFSSHPDAPVRPLLARPTVKSCSPPDFSHHTHLPISPTQASRSESIPTFNPPKFALSNCRSEVTPESLSLSRPRSSPSLPLQHLSSLVCY